MTTPEQRNNLNLDPITDEPGAHPVGTGLGAGGGALAGAAAGAIGGPVGAAVGAVVGAVAGGLAGHGVAEAINPTAEEAYWRSTYDKQDYYRSDYSYDDYAPAYRAGWEERAAGRDRWEQVRDDWSRRWDGEPHGSRLRWYEAEPAAKAAWERANEHYVFNKQE
ncbi:hypothetical protein [Pantoea sp. 18069]|uniref:hypothetical protein n=1 Tax=Pantoea sp. 18069 TaxID=2681415 RepID=UPI001357514A|nr:hypothetical protein [Pantoea sp. 18069]